MRFNEIKKPIKEDQDLFEINMSPTNLKKLAAQTGALAGMEFEMIVPGADTGDEYDLEPDYDQDQRCRSIEDAVQFFDDGDYNDSREVQRLRERMENDFQEWLDDKIRNDYDSDGQEFVRDWVGNNVDESEWNPDDLEGTARAESLEEFADTVAGDPNNDYYQQAYDDYREENQDSYDESDWLDAEDLDLMSSVENAYEISWPHWGGSSGQGASIEEVADEFREAIGRKVNWSGSYHGGKREANTYVVEPDGSLEPDESTDSGLEFVSPPLPIDEMISDLNKVKAWADQRGCYTSKAAKTGLHINVSVPGFDNDKLDYVKLALLLGDEYVLNQFGRLGNSYANSAMGIIKERIAQRPEDAAAMLQKMKAGLGELATKVIHSGTTSKFTSINTKEGYIEFRSPGGDWLNENFDKIETTLLRFVVALDAAMDPAKYLQEYQQKLYKLLTGQQSGRTKSNLQWDISSKAMIWTKDQRFARGKDAFTARQTPAFSTTVTAKTAKEAWEKAKPSPDAKASEYKIEPRSAAGPDNDALLKIFSKWSTGEMSEAELSKGLKQAQLERKGKKGGSDSAYTAIPSSGNQKYQIQRKVNDEIVGTFNAASNTDADAVARQWMADNALQRVEYRLVRATGQERAEQRTGASNYNIYQIPDGRTVGTFYAADPDQADAAFTDWLMGPGDGRDDFRYAPIDTPIQGPAASTPRPRPDIIDIEPDIEQYFAPGSTQDIQQRRAAGGEFTGVWRVMNVDTGEELYRFSGAGNSQSDANGVALEWIRRNAPNTDLVQIEVVPIMS